MSMLPSLRAQFDKALNSSERAEAIEKLRAIKGVLSVGYNEKAGVANVTYLAGQDVVKQARAIAGLKIDDSHRL